MTTYGNRYEHDPFADYRCQQHLAVVDLDGCWMCPDCRKSSVVVDYTTGDYICNECGRVICDKIMDGAIDVCRLPTKTYVRVHHFSERDKQWNCCEPRIPDDLFACIEGAFIDLCETDQAFDRSFQLKPYRKSHVQRILRQVRLSPEMQVKHQSRKFKKTLFTDARLYEKYTEKCKCRTGGSFLWLMASLLLFPIYRIALLTLKRSTNMMLIFDP